MIIAFLPEGGHQLVKMVRGMIAQALEAHLLELRVMTAHQPRGVAEAVGHAGSLMLRQPSPGRVDAAQPLSRSAAARQSQG